MPSGSSRGANGDTAHAAPEGWAAGLRPRIVSAVVMAVAALIAVASGPLSFAFLVAAGAAILAWEWVRLTGAGRFGVTGLALAFTVLSVIAAAFAERPLVAVAGALASAGLVFLVASRSGRAHPGWIAAGPIYIGVPSVALIWLRSSDPAGRELILWLLLTVWATDIGAFFAGRLIGGPKLAPRISPKKTWAGLLGAIVCAVLVGFAASRFDPAAPAAVLLAAAGALLAVVAQAGDLGESWVKRHFGAKDASHLIPGHGGLFDRVDGLLAAATVLAAAQLASGGALSWR